MNKKVYRKGDVIFRQGDAAESMFDICWGKVGIYLDYGTAKEKKVAELEGDAFFGEMGMIDRAQRSATAVALEDQTQLQEITEDGLGELFREKPAKVLMIMQNLSHRLRKLTDSYLEACRTAAGIVKVEEKSEGISDEFTAELSAKAEHYACVEPLGYDVGI